MQVWGWLWSLHHSAKAHQLEAKDHCTSMGRTWVAQEQWGVRGRCLAGMDETSWAGTQQSWSRGSAGCRCWKGKQRKVKVRVRCYPASTTCNRAGKTPHQGFSPIMPLC